MLEKARSSRRRLQYCFRALIGAEQMFQRVKVVYLRISSNFHVYSGHLSRSTLCASADAIFICHSQMASGDKMGLFTLMLKQYL